MIKENLYLFLNIWLGIIGGILGVGGKFGVFIFSQVEKLGVSIIEYSFKYDNF